MRGLARETERERGAEVKDDGEMGRKSVICFFFPVCFIFCLFFQGVAPRRHRSAVPYPRW